MTEFREWMERMGLDVAGAARALGMTYQAAWLLANGTNRPRGSTKTAMRLLEEQKQRQEEEEQ
jgi:hypothetical protein